MLQTRFQLEHYSLSENKKYILLVHDISSRNSYSFTAKYKIYDTAQSLITHLNGSSAAASIYDEDPLQFASWGPKGSQLVSFELDSSCLSFRSLFSSYCTNSFPSLFPYYSLSYFFKNISFICLFQLNCSIRRDKSEHWKSLSLPTSSFLPLTFSSLLLFLASLFFLPYFLPYFLSFFSFLYGQESNVIPMMITPITLPVSV